MLELVTTRHNPMVDPALHVWGWEIPVYLFLGGWVAGSMVLAGWFMRQGRRQRAAGLTVNAHANIPRDQYDRLKATLYNCARRGPAGRPGNGRGDRGILSSA